MNVTVEAGGATKSQRYSKFDINIKLKFILAPTGAQNYSVMYTVELFFKKKKSI